MLYQFQSLKEQARTVIRHLNSQDLAIRKTYDLTSTEERQAKIEESTNSLKSQAKALLDAYNHARERAITLGAELPTIDPQNKTTRGYLREIIIGANTAIGFFGEGTVGLSLADTDRLQHIREESKEVCAQMDANFGKNLEIAIRDMEHGSFLGSALITSRVVSYMLSAIQGKDVNEKISTLISKGVVDKERDDVKQAIIKADKKSRDVFAHRIDVLADPSDALSLLGDCIKLMRIYSKAYSH